MTRQAQARALALGALIALGAAGCANTYHDKGAYAGNTTAEKRAPSQAVSDAAITAKVKTAFAADATVKAHNIDVDTMRGVVTLHGTVGSAAEKDKAISIARNTSGVLDVKDDLKVAG